MHDNFMWEPKTEAFDKREGAKAFDLEHETYLITLQERI